MGASIINCTSYGYIGAGALTVTANTATINCSGNFAGGGITTYNIVNLTGATSTVSGNNTFAELNVSAATTVTLGATTQTMGKWSCLKAPAANTATLIVDGTFDGGGFTTYYKVQIAGDTTMTGNNTFDTLDFDASAGAVTLTGTAGSVQSVTNFTRDAGTNIVTLASTGAFWELHKNGGGYVSVDYMSISNNHAT
jgi:hypothetical protein